MAANQDNQTHNMSQKRPAQDEEGAPASKFSRSAVTASVGGLGGAAGLDAMGCASQQFGHALAYTSSPGGGSPQSSAPASTVGAGGAAGSSGVFVFVQIHTYVDTYIKMRSCMNLPVYLFIMTISSLSLQALAGDPRRGPVHLLRTFAQPSTPFVAQGPLLRPLVLFSTR
jgi:hypothetical protein